MMMPSIFGETYLMIGWISPFEKDFFGTKNPFTENMRKI